MDTLVVQRVCRAECGPCCADSTPSQGRPILSPKRSRGVPLLLYIWSLRVTIAEAAKKGGAFARGAGPAALRVSLVSPGERRGTGRYRSRPRRHLAIACRLGADQKCYDTPASARSVGRLDGG